jgi:hypothetical protein
VRTNWTVRISAWSGGACDHRRACSPATATAVSLEQVLERWWVVAKVGDAACRCRQRALAGEVVDGDSRGQGTRPAEVRLR